MKKFFFFRYACIPKSYCVPSKDLSGVSEC